MEELDKRARALRRAPRDTGVPTEVLQVERWMRNRLYSRPSDRLLPVLSLASL